MSYKPINVFPAQSPGVLFVIIHASAVVKVDGFIVTLLSVDGHPQSTHPLLQCSHSSQSIRLYRSLLMVKLWYISAGVNGLI